MLNSQILKKFINEHNNQSEVIFIDFIPNTSNYLIISFKNGNLIFFKIFKETITKIFEIFYKINKNATQQEYFEKVYFFDFCEHKLILEDNFKNIVVIDLELNGEIVFIYRNIKMVQDNPIIYSEFFIKNNLNKLGNLFLNEFSKNDQNVVLKEFNREFRIGTMNNYYR